MSKVKSYGEDTHPHGYVEWDGPEFSWIGVSGEGENWRRNMPDGMLEVSVGPPTLDEEPVYLHIPREELAEFLRMVNERFSLGA